MTQLWLARAAIAECGWRPTNCAAALWWTLRRRWQQIPSRVATYRLDDLLRAYCTIFKGEATSRGEWVRSLSAEATQPQGWPAARASWARHRPIWSDVHRRAGAFLAGKLKDPCTGEPTHTGNHADTRRSNGCVWQAAECGDTGGQHFGGWVCQ